MIPNFSWTVIQLGPIPIQVWGLCVAIGVLVGLWLGAREAVRRGVKKELFWDSSLWIVVAGFIGARLSHVLFYEPAFFVKNPLEILMVWHGGMSSLGGFLGAAIFGVWYLRRKKINIWKYADAAAFGLPIGWMIGRIGCFLIHDHPGTLTDFALAVREPGVLGEEGFGRHDLGLYDAILAGIIALAVLALRKKKKFDGYFILLIAGLYAVPRFFLDYLRASDLSGSDARYAGLTPAQYASVIALVFVLYMWYKKRK